MRKGPGVAPRFQEERARTADHEGVALHGGQFVAQDIGERDEGALKRGGRGDVAARDDPRDVGGREILTEEDRVDDILSGADPRLFGRGKDQVQDVAAGHMMIRLGTGSPAWVGLALCKDLKVTSVVLGRMAGNSESHAAGDAALERGGKTREGARQLGRVGILHGDRQRRDAPGRDQGQRPGRARVEEDSDGDRETAARIRRGGGGHNVEAVCHRDRLEGSRIHRRSNAVGRLIGLGGDINTGVLDADRAVGENGDRRFGRIEAFRVEVDLVLAQVGHTHAERRDALQRRAAAGLDVHRGVGQAQAQGVVHHDTALGDRAGAGDRAAESGQIDLPRRRVHAAPNRFSPATTLILPPPKADQVARKPGSIPRRLKRRRWSGKRWRPQRDIGEHCRRVRRTENIAARQSSDPFLEKELGIDQGVDHRADDAGAPAAARRCRSTSNGLHNRGTVTHAAQPQTSNCVSRRPRTSPPAVRLTLPPPSA